MSISVDKRLLVLIAVRDSILQPPREVRSRPMLEVSPGAPVAARGRGASRAGRPAPTYLAADSLARATAAETVSVPMRAAIGRRERGSTGRRARTALALLASLSMGCGMRPLRTPQAIPSSRCRPDVPTGVQLQGFGRAGNQALHDRLASLLRESGYEVIEGGRPSDDSSTRRFSLTLADLFRHDKPTASGRRMTNVYFAVTVVDAWIIPILQASPLYDSELELEAYVAVADASARVLWTGREELTLTEKPTGFPGPDDGEFGTVMLERAEENLAVRLYDRFCEVISRNALGTESGPSSS